MDNTFTEDTTATQIGCKFGLYTAADGDKKIRFRHFKSVVYNSNKGFSIVNPS